MARSYFRVNKINNTKICSRCKGDPKPLDDFYLLSNGRYESCCKSCNKSYVSNRYHTLHPESPVYDGYSLADVNRKRGEISFKQSLARKQKVCSRCLEPKPVDKFSLKKSRATGRMYPSSWCKACCSYYNNVVKPAAPKPPQPELSYSYPYGPDSHDLIDKINAIVPKSLPYEIRPDICQEMVLSVLSGEPIETLNYRPFLTKYFRSYNPKKMVSYSHPGYIRKTILGEWGD